jgi:hypothetical protein
LRSFRTYPTSRYKSRSEIFHVRMFFILYTWTSPKADSPNQCAVRNMPIISVWVENTYTLSLYTTAAAPRSGGRELSARFLETDKYIPGPVLCDTRTNIPNIV